jgi:hypothetical protein
MAEANYSEQFKEITSKQSVDEQALTFLRAFVFEFQGKFEEILELAEKFKVFSGKVGQPSSMWSLVGGVGGGTVVW